MNDPSRLIRHAHFARRALQSLTPDGTTEDLEHVATSGLFSRDQLALFRCLAREEHPGPYLESSLSRTPELFEPAPLPASEPTHVPLDADAWPSDALGARLRWIVREEGRRQGTRRPRDEVRPEPLEVPDGFVRALDAQRALMPLRPAVPSHAAWVRWAVSGIYESMKRRVYGHVFDALLSLTGTHDPLPPHYSPLIGHVRSAVVGGAGMMRPPEPIVLEESALSGLPDLLQRAPAPLDPDELTMTCALLATLRRGGQVTLDDYLARYTFEPQGRVEPLDEGALSVALAATFPMWDARLERRVLPLDHGLMRTLVARCDHVGASPDELERTRALAWRRLTALCLLEPEGVWSEHLTRALEARQGVGDLTALVVGLDLYCAGFVSHGARIWLTRPRV